MTVSESQKNASKKYLQKLDEVRIRMPKGKREQIKQHAAKHGESMNAFVLRAVEEAMEKDND